MRMRKSWLEAFWEAGLVLRRSAGGGDVGESQNGDWF